MNLNITKKKLTTGFPFVCYEDRFALCGQPKPEDLKEFKKESWTNVLNLRNQSELDSLDFKMESCCQELALDYNHIPVIVDGNLNKASLKKIHELISQAGSELRFVIHCASGTRSSLVLMMHFLFSKSCQPEVLPLLAEKLEFNHPQMLLKLSQFID